VIPIGCGSPAVTKSARAAIRLNLTAVGRRAIALRAAGARHADPHGRGQGLLDACYELHQRLPVGRVPEAFINRPGAITTAVLDTAKQADESGRDGTTGWRQPAKSDILSPRARRIENAGAVRDGGFVRRAEGPGQSVGNTVRTGPLHGPQMETSFVAALGPSRYERPESALARAEPRKARQYGWAARSGSSRLFTRDALVRCFWRISSFADTCSSSGEVVRLRKLYSLWSPISTQLEKLTAMYSPPLFNHFTAPLWSHRELLRIVWAIPVVCWAFASPIFLAFRLRHREPGNGPAVLCYRSYVSWTRCQVR